MKIRERAVLNPALLKQQPGLGAAISQIKIACRFRQLHFEEEPAVPLPFVGLLFLCEARISAFARSTRSFASF